VGSSGIGSVLRSVLVICLGSVGVLTFAIGAAGSSPRLHRHNDETGLIGDYDIFTCKSPSGTLTLNSDGTFTRSNGDSGQWLVWRKNVVLNVFSSTVGNMACIYLGVAERTGINSSSDPGPSNCHKAKSTWYAVKSAGVLSRPGPTDATTVDGRSGPPVVGTYHESNTSGDPSAKLFIRADGVDDILVPPELEVGYWVEHDGALAFGVVDSETGALAGCVFVGITTTEGINSAQSPGLLDCNGHRFHWYATRTKR
jgi:hypothetical protein